MELHHSRSRAIYLHVFIQEMEVESMKSKENYHQVKAIHMKKTATKFSSNKSKNFFILMKMSSFSMKMLMFSILKGLECGNCVLQWRYIAGNNWGMCDNGTGKLNCIQILENSKIISFYSYITKIELNRRRITRSKIEIVIKSK